MKKIAHLILIMSAFICLLYTGHQIYLDQKSDINLILVFFINIIIIFFLISVNDIEEVKLLGTSIKLKKLKSEVEKTIEGLLEFQILSIKILSKVVTSESGMFASEEPKPDGVDEFQELLEFINNSKMDENVRLKCFQVAKKVLDELILKQIKIMERKADPMMADSLQHATLDSVRNAVFNEKRIESFIKRNKHENRNEIISFLNIAFSSYENLYSLRAQVKSKIDTLSTTIPTPPTSP